MKTGSSELGVGMWITNHGGTETQRRKITNEKE